jgi:AcrR family transcriptional regulator
VEREQRLSVKKGHIDLERVVQVAVDLADRQSFDAVSLAKVAEELGIRIPSLYNYVTGLPGLRYQMALWGLRQATDKLRRAAVGKAGDEAVYAIAIAYREFALAHPGIYAAALRSDLSGSPEGVVAGKEIVEVAAAVLAFYGFNGDDALHAVRALRSVLHGFVDLEVGGGFGLPLDCEESFRRLVHMLIQGFHAQHEMNP